MASKGTTIKYGIPEAAKRMGFTPSYVRSLIRKGQLASTMEPLVPESLVTHHVITETTIVAYFGQKHGTHRLDGRNKFVIYMNPDERVRVHDVLIGEGLEDVEETIRSWNHLKPRPVAVVKKAKKVKHDVASVA